ncbi:hypothetical protein S7335_2748 [Synechococcus sp. PCC 7335]|uniref:hypothetical protein n=1 Tax=Synechococcus sp. (strain ATCC 29403 / PCC 7335) TaxID=91464 RepID=UPI00017EE3DB|nr:hypothetical protein [Synechococcus sp. PCC 7335]EDX85049.1 hypothetical protein S7335_2748 [Synechococcus sp. PCC 7335]
MLKSYEAIYENGQVKWLNEQPVAASARIIVTVLEEFQVSTTTDEQVKPKRRTFPTELAGQVKILGDIVSPIVDEEDWECLK